MVHLRMECFAFVEEQVLDLVIYFLLLRLQLFFFPTSVVLLHLYIRQEVMFPINSLSYTKQKELTAKKAFRGGEGYLAVILYGFLVS